MSVVRGRWACALQLVLLAIHGHRGAEYSTGCRGGHGDNCVASEHSSLTGHLKRWSKYLQLINDSLNEYESEPSSAYEANCPYTTTITADLAVWKERGGITRQDFLSARQERFRGVHYQVIEHKLYREPDCMFGPRCTGVEHFIKQCIQDLPNMEFIVNVRDFPLSSRHFQPPLPVLSFSKTSEYYDIMYPAWSFWSGGPAIATEPRGLGRWDLKRQSITKEADLWPWEKKMQIGFFRGSRTTGERDPLILLSRESPDLVDAQYTKNQAWKSDKDTLGAPPADVVTLEDHCKYKYLFNFRGVAASFRHRHLFLCRSLVLHVGEEWVEFYYPSLRPWVHFVPVKQDLSDVKEVLQFVRENDHVTKEIANRGFQAIWNDLDTEDVLCYWRTLLLEYADLAQWTVELIPEYIAL